MFNLFETHKKNSQNKILDLGCGAGLLVKHKIIFSEVEITGLDFATKMIDLSKNLTLTTDENNETNIINVKEQDQQLNSKPKTIYDFLIKNNFNKFADFSKQYDIIVSRGFLNYQNNHNEIITKISQLLTEKGYFIGYINNNLSQESCLDKRDNFSTPFFHNYQQIEFTKLNDIFIKNSFNLITKQEFALEKDNLAIIFIYQKK